MMLSAAPFDIDVEDVVEAVGESTTAEEANSNGLARRYPSCTPDCTVRTRKSAIARTHPSTAGSTLPIIVIGGVCAVVEAVVLLLLSSHLSLPHSIRHPSLSALPTGATIDAPSAPDAGPPCLLQNPNRSQASTSPQSQHPPALA